MIDLRSDTLTKPTDRMRSAARDAKVGDDKRDSDPTVADLERMVASRLGMEAGLFVPSGTMGNQIAARTLASPGEEVILDRYAHAYSSEFGSLAQLSSLQIRSIDSSSRGCPSPTEIREAYSERKQWPGIGLLILENTHNERGGFALDPEIIESAAQAGRRLNIPVHLDGARLANAAVVHDRSLAAFTDSVDSVMFDLSKGLGAPVGAVIAGSEEFISEARNYRNAFGGGMRQAGIIAAPGIVAMDNVDRLETDHENASHLAKGLDNRTELRVRQPETNIVLANTEPMDMSIDTILARFEENGVRAVPIGDFKIRFCTYYDIDREDIDLAVDRISQALNQDLN